MKRYYPMLCALLLILCAIVSATLFYIVRMKPEPSAPAPTVAKDSDKNKPSDTSISGSAAYPNTNTEETVTTEPTLETDHDTTDSAADSESNYPETEQAQGESSDLNSPVNTISVASSPERETYQDSFFSQPITDDIRQRIDGVSYKEDCTVPYEELRYLQVLHTDFEGTVKTGELICNRVIASDLLEIFYELYRASYPIAELVLIDNYGADDNLSMEHNNSSSFNFRKIAGKDKLSNHSLGLAVDINPLYNPYISEYNTPNIVPANAEVYADRSGEFQGKITHDDFCYQLFTEHGFTWGGDWNSVKDYQHFEKPNP